MGGSKPKSRSKTMAGKSSRKKGHQEKQKMDPKLLAIALIFVMLFVSFAVIITTQEAPQSSKNMVFYQDRDVPSTRTGNVRDINVDLSNVRMEIKDESADSTNSTDTLKDGTVLETDGGFNCTFFDKNQNNKMDDEDEFIVHNVATGDWVKLYLGSSDDELAFYTFDVL
ncbi:MAG: hypothetical protein JSV09_04655 [Thermoplasmata archaeon]|nr:MAG: hypothetical protein JSV09_04655 [Thermoplasmata archaeon]